MKERESERGKDEEVNGQGGNRGAQAPHGATLTYTLGRDTFKNGLFCNFYTEYHITYK